MQNNINAAHYATKFSIYGCLASVVSLSFLALACQFSSLSDASITRTSVGPSQGRRILLKEAIADVDCGDILLYSDEKVQLCHYAKNCKSSGWPSRILLPLLLCHGVAVDDSSSSAIQVNAKNDNNATTTTSATTTSTTLSTILLVILLFPPLLLYLLLLFRLLATTADNYFSPSLETFSFELGLPPRFAGATLLALGNGSPDLGSTINAILLWNEKKEFDSTSASAATTATTIGGGGDYYDGDKMTTQGWIMSIGNLIGGGMFVGTIVCGLLVKECSGIQCRGAFLRDVSVYAFSVGYVWYVLESKRVTRVDAWTLLGIWITYVGIVFCSDVFHRKVTVKRINREAKQRRNNLRVEKASRLRELYEKIRGEVTTADNNLREDVVVDESTPIAPFGTTLPSYGDGGGEDDATVNYDDDIVSDILPSFDVASFERRVPRPRLSITDRVALFMSNYDSGSVRHLGSISTITDESRDDSEIGTIFEAIHDIRPPLLRAVSSSFLDDVPSTTHSPPGESILADESFLERMDTPQQSNRNIPSPPPSDASSIAPKERSWSFDLLIDAYEELAFQAHHFWENSFQNKTSMIEKIGSFLEMPFIICRVLTIPLPVEDHYCRPVVALSTAGSPFWLLYYREKEFWTVSATAFILVALVIALAILRYADDNKMPLVTCIPLSLYGFLIAATWIDSIGGALVDLLQFFGTFLRIPPGILGMTVLAVGNSMGDLSSNLAMARNGVSFLSVT